ncbi:hypothetical protein IEQ34_009391 [Dendrobium chrysotoxum]|uniref:Protein KAKU4 n=1 Tax=Dendrobium chrysotoxum TaxID=161865 RepID=A0AAV7GYL0_DENCH|nr:hypothetical protein IEQ34_009391 [Dendrobium chrysotoxum]
MASSFPSRQWDELGSGGKIIDGRRRLLPSFSPYSRPPSTAALIPHPVPEAQTGRSLNWLRGLFSGIGKLFLSVLSSEDNSPSPSECFSNSDDYYDYSLNEHEDQLHSDDLTSSKMRESEAKRNVESLAIFPKSETKLIIEQLLLQETFTRDECKKLVEMIQSRVPEVNSVEIGEGTENEVPIMITDQGQSLNHNRNLYQISNFSPRILPSLSPSFYAKEAVIPDLRNKAVMEAKRWFEEKKLTPSPTYDRSYGLRNLTTRMNQYGFEDGAGSPIEMAKSYLQSLPPWRSPSFSTNGFMTSPSCGNSSCNFGSQLVATSEVKKRDYISIGSFNSEENCRTYLKSLDNEQEFSKFGQSKLLSRLSAHEASTTPSAAAKTCNEVEGTSSCFYLSKLLFIYFIIDDASGGDNFSDNCLKFQDANAAGADQLMETDNGIDNGISVGAILQSKEVFKESQEGPKVAASNNIEGLHYDIVNMLPNDADMSVSDASQVNCVKNVEMPLPIEEQIGSISAPKDSFASIADRNNGDSFPETETLQLDNITPTEPSLNKNSGDEVKFLATNSMQVDVDAAFNNTHPVTDSELRDENPQTQDEAIIRSGEKFEASSNLAEINNMKSDLESTSKGDPTETSSSYGGAPAASVSEGTLEPVSDVSIGIRITRASITNASKAHNGKDTNYVERMQTGPPEPSRGNKRKAKQFRKVCPLFFFINFIYHTLVMWKNRIEFSLEYLQLQQMYVILKFDTILLVFERFPFDRALILMQSFFKIRI